VLRREIDRVTHLPFASPSAFLPNNADVEAFRLSLRPAQEQHRDLLDAIVKREGTRAEAIAREHARAPRRNLDILLAGQPDLLARMPALALLITESEQWDVHRIVAAHVAAADTRVSLKKQKVRLGSFRLFAGRHSR